MRSTVATLLLLVTACGGDEGPSAPMTRERGRQCEAVEGIESNATGSFDMATGAPVRRVVLMGGGSEVNAASRVFVESANGGDVLVLRASGSTTSYNAYFREDVLAQPRPSSVTTIRIYEPAASAADGLLCRLANVEAVWLAGGDQWDYVGGWESPLHTTLTELVERDVAIGGTSAGAVVLGEAAFDARNGSVGSDEALADPLGAAVSVSLSPMAQPELDGWIVDSHFAQREREGRMLAFLARMLALTGRDTVYGVGLDERAALVIADDAFEVLAANERYAWLYRVIGPVPLVAGEPLSIVAERVRHAAGAEGSWPASFADADTVRVVDGVVENGLSGAAVRQGERDG